MLSDGNRIYRYALTDFPSPKFTVQKVWGINSVVNAFRFHNTLQKV